MVEFNLKRTLGASIGGALALLYLYGTGQVIHPITPPALLILIVILTISVKKEK